MLDFVAQVAGTVIPFVLVLTLVVTIHELGHFLTARAFGVKIDRFSIGFGKALASFTDRSGVEWRVGWLPLGGYVKFAGDLNASGVPDREGLAELRREIIEAEGAGAERRYFHFKPVWQRAAVVAAGPFANFVLAVVIFTVLALAAGEILLVKPRVGSVEPGSPAAAAGFQPGDLIERADGRAITDWSQLSQHVMVRAGEPIRFDIDRSGQDLSLTATPARVQRADPISGAATTLGYLGVGASNGPGDVVRHRYGLVDGVAEGFSQTWGVLDVTLTYLRRVVTGRESGDQLGGPIGIANASGSIAGAAVDAGEGFGDKARNVFFALLALSGLLSVGIGFLNLLPVPVLDGGHLLFYAYEAVARRPLGAKVQEAGYRVGLALLLGLMLFATWNDLQKLSVFKFLGELVS